MASIKIKSVSIKNYRSFGEQQIFEFHNESNKPIAIIGYNNAGKTNLINAIRFGLYESVREDTFELKDFHNNIWQNKPEIKLDFIADINDEHLITGRTFSNSIQVRVSDDKIDNVEDSCNCYAGTKKYSKKWVIKQNAPIFYVNFHNIKEEISTQKTNWGNIKSFLGKHIQKIVMNDNVLQSKKEDFTEKLKNVTNSALDGSGLETFINIIKKNYESNLRDNTCTIEFGLPSYEDIFLTMMFKVGLNSNPDKLIPLSHFGDGFISMFAMAVIQAIAESYPDDKCLFLFEEPETFLHENHQEYFYKTVLCALAESGHQVIYTTHSDKMIDPFNVKSIIRIELDNNNQTIKKYNNTQGSVPTEGQYDEPINIEKFNQYITTVEPNLNRMLFSKKVLLVEGANDVLVYKHGVYKKVLDKIQNMDNIPKKERYANAYLNFKNISIICHNGKTTSDYIIQLCKHFGIDYYVISDWDIGDVISEDMLKSFSSKDVLEQSPEYTSADANLKRGLTNNLKIIRAAKVNQLHFNNNNLEEVIRYTRNDKNSYEIWKIVDDDNFPYGDEVFPESLINFLEIDRIQLHEGN